MNTLKTFTPLLLAVSLVLPVAASAGGVPTVDMGTILQLRANYDMAKTQFEEAEKTYKALYGNRDIGRLFSDPKLAKYLPQDMKQMFEDYRAGDYAAIAKRIEQLQKGEKLNGDQAAMLKNLTKREADFIFGSKVQIDEMFRRSNERFNQITRLMNTIDKTQDPKAAADLLNRIQVESAMIQMQQNQLKLAEMAMKAEERLIKQQKLELRRKRNSANNFKYTQRAPVYQGQ